MIKQNLNTNIYSKRCRDFVNKLSRITTNLEYGKQLARSSGSVAANHIEANESTSKKDFFHRVKIARKEAKESRLWVRLCDVRDNDDLIKEQEWLINESTELVKIFTSIINKEKV